MIKYWPNQPSIKLNNAIVELFIITEKKVKTNIFNETNYYLYTDILNIDNKRKLFKIILSEFKILLLDLIELNLNPKQIKYLHTKILVIFIHKVYEKFKLNTNNLQDNIQILIDKNKVYTIKELIIYLIFGSSTIKQSVFSFNPLYTPYNHIQILFENFIIYSSNIVMKNIIDNLSNSASIYNFLKNTNKCNYLYTSNRSITLFLNNLKWQNLIEFYIYNTKYLYNEREQVLLISSKGIIMKYIYNSNIERIKSLNQFQIIFLFWLEIKDLIIPKIEKAIIQVSRYIIFFLINFFSNLIIILVRFLIFYLNK